MHRSRCFTVPLLLIYVLAVAVPPEARAADPQRGRLGAGLGAVAAGKAPDRTIVTMADEVARKIAVSVEFAQEPGSAIRARLRSAGLDLRGSWGRTIEGYIRPERLKSLAATPGVVTVRAIRAPVADTNASPAPALHGALSWQQAQYSGKGVKIGILDGGFDGFAGLMGSELPGNVQARCYAQLGIASSTLADCETQGETHGTAVAESIIDMAPGAALYVSNAYSRADLAAAISWMTAAGVRIINFSQGWGPEGMGDGTSGYVDSIYGLVDQAVAAGALFVASAGNEGEMSWLGPATDANSNGWLDFAPGDEGNALDLRAGDEIDVVIRWGSAASDYDLSIWQDNSKLAESVDSQSQTRDPVEILSFTAPATGTYEISVSRYSGPPALAMRLMVLSQAAASLRYSTTAGSLPAPADSRNPGMVTVGAVNYRTPSVIEPYSSRGPTLDGRIKPDLVAVDCAPTTIEPVFCGTSQSAPFVTGAAALLLEADPTLTPVSLASLLKQRATPLGSPVPNNTFGSGLLSLGQTPAQVPVAVAFLAPPASGTAGAPLLGQPAVGIVDAEGRATSTGPGATMSVTLSLAGNPTGAILTCDGGTTRTAVAGTAAFTGCSVDRPGSGYTLRADVASLTAGSSTPFSVVPAGTAPRVSLTLAPTSVKLGTTLAGTASVTPGAGGSLVLEWSKDARIWTPSGDVALDPAGNAQLTLTPRSNRWVRGRIVNPDGTTDVSLGLLVRVNATVVLASSIPSGRTILRTTKVTLTETIRPVGVDVARGRARFDFFLRVGTSWVRKRTLYANADPATGLARIVTSLPSAGSWWVRSRAEPTTSNEASAWTAGYKYVVR